MAEPGFVFAGVAGFFGKPDWTAKVGVFRRPAAGGEWSHILPTTQAFTVFVHPENPELVFAGTKDGVWRSTDRGASFRRAEFPDSGKEVWCFMVDRRDPKRMLAGA